MRVALSFKRTQAAFEFGQVSCLCNIFILAALFGSLEAATDMLKKEGKEHEYLQEYCFGLTQRCDSVDEIGFASCVDGRQNAFQAGEKYASLSPRLTAGDMPGVPSGNTPIMEHWLHIFDFTGAA